MADKDPELEALQQKLDAELDRKVRPASPDLVRNVVLALAFIGLVWLLVGAACTGCEGYLSSHVHT